MFPFELERTRRELGIPDGEPVACVKMDAEQFNPQWAGFRLEFFGIVAPPPPPDELACIYAESEGVGIRVWRVRVRKDGAQAYIEAKTRPGWIGYTSIDLRGLDPFNRTDNQDVLVRGIAMLYPRPIRPRREGRSRTVEDLLAGYQDFYDVKQDYPTKGELAAELGVSPKTIGRIVGEPWETFAARARRKTQSRTIRFVKP